MPSPRQKPRRDTKSVVDRAARDRRRFCRYCSEKLEEVESKDLAALRRAMSEKGKIRPRRVTGTCRRHQNQVAVAVKRAREMALLPYVNS